MEQSINPYKVLGVSNNFTLEQLQSQYKQSLLKYHTDSSKDIRSTPMFHVLTGCYKMLMDEYKKRPTKEKGSISSRIVKSIFSRAPSVGQEPSPSLKPSFDPNKNFDSVKFNTLFEKHRIPDITDDGYGKWINENTQDLQKRSHAYNTPQPINLAHDLIGKSGTDFYELGVSKIDDYSADNISKGAMSFMDYRVAHTTEKIVDLNDIVERKQYSSVQELEKERALPVIFDSRENKLYQQQLYTEEQKEKKRLQVLEKHDKMISNQYNQTSRLFL